MTQPRAVQATPAASHGEAVLSGEGLQRGGDPCIHFSEIPQSGLAFHSSRSFRGFATLLIL